MVTGIDLIRAQTKYRPKEHQKLPSKKPLVATIDELLRYDVRTTINTLICLFIRCFMTIYSQFCSIAKYCEKD